jgi:hypothetical protein
MGEYHRMAFSSGLFLFGDSNDPEKEKAISGSWPEC